jgi:hypothetical protein
MRRDKKPEIVTVRPLLNAEAEAAARTAGSRVVRLSPLSEIILAWAKKGDWSILADYIEGGGWIGHEIRRFLISVLRQEMPKPNNRAPAFKTVLGANGITERVRFFISLEQRGVGRECAIDETAEKFNTNRRTIQRKLEEAEDAVRLLIAIRGAIDIAGTCNEKRAFVISSTALTQHFMS